MTYPQTYDASFFPILASDIPLVVTRNTIHHHFPLHRHDVMEISLVLSGDGVETINGMSHPMTPGTVTVIMPYQFHEIHSTGSTPLVLFNCMFGLELLLASPTNQERAIVDSLLATDSTEPYVLKLAPTAHRKVESLLGDLLVEFNRHNPYKHTMLKSKMLELLIHLERERTSSAQPSQLRPENTDPLASKILLYLHQAYREEISLEDAANHFHISTTLLASTIRRSVGKSYLELLHEIRLRHACSLLLSSDMSVADLALEAGFQSAQTFFRVFKQAKGITPNAYRKANVFPIS
ncbi:helix-turn-helix transcriptional regulator [Paenibacillus roseipurpureus]|uniref:AraC family transcriptional regulator n=1 Tax=Paenibacillus roseopurpureus TaxID=2918901 RepID=A0AA96LS51_9BACL|nr:AraC family transcriptional regulator [Paenibacillus sp. MBLB1832]WNR46212.1 AraC family transcriptional regulator [Paenibacillus sp. MBLB1832]